MVVSGSRGINGGFGQEAGAPPKTKQAISDGLFGMAVCAPIQR